MTIFGARDGEVQALGTVATEASRIVVTEADGYQHILDLGMAGRTAKGKAGALAALPGPGGALASWTCVDVCRTVSGLVCGLSLRVQLLGDVLDNSPPRRACCTCVRLGLVRDLLPELPLGRKRGMHSDMQLTDLAQYAPFAVAVVVLALAIAAPAYATHRGGAWARSPLAALPNVRSTRLPSVLATFVAAFVIFVAVDLLSGHAISSLGSNSVIGPLAFGLVIAVIAVDVIYLLARRRRADR